LKDVYELEHGSHDTEKGQT